MASVFFWLYPHPQTLVAFQCFCIAVGAAPIFLLARDQLANRWYAVGLAALYLISPAVWGVNQYEYHDLALSIPFLIFAVYFYSVGKFARFLLALVLALAANPFIIIVSSALALSMFIDNWERGKHFGPLRFPAVTMAAVGGFAVYLQIIPETFSYHFATLGASTYSLTGSTSYLNPATVLAQPLSSLAYATPLKAIYLLGVLGPTLFLPLLSLRKFLPGLPWIGVVILYSRSLGSGGVGAVYEFSQWSSFLIPFVFVGAIYGFRRLVHSRHFLRQRLIEAKQLLVLMMIISILTMLS